MKILIIALFLGISANLALAQVPQDVREEMRLEQPEYRESQWIAPLTAAAVLHFPRAKLWVVTKLHMIEPGLWIFKDKDIELIAREVNGKLATLYERKEET